MKQKVITSLVLGTLLTGVIPAVFAADYTTDEIVVTGTRMKMSTKDIAANVTVISKEDLDKGNYATMSEALKGANVNVIDKGGIAYPILNGDGRVLVLVNGRRINFDHLQVSGQENAVNINAIPLAGIDRIEVVCGPNSSLYGEKAVGGVINIIMKEPEVGTKTTVTAEYGSFDSRRFGIVTTGGDDKQGFMVAYSKYKTDNYKYKDANGNSHEFPDSYVDEDALALRYDRYIGDDRATFEFNRAFKNNGFGIYLTNPLKGISYGNGSTYHATNTDMALTYTFDAANDGDGTFIRVSQVQEKADSPFAGTPYSHDLKSYALEGQKVWKVGVHSIVGGFAWDRQSLWENNDGSTMDRSATTKSIFAEDLWTINDVWSMNLGTRYEHHSDFGGDWASHIGLNRKIGKDTHAYVSWGQAVNNPTLKMRFANTPYMTGNPDLKQETSQTYTIGVDSQLSDKWSVSASAYQSDLKNALNWAWDGITRYYNSDREKRRGFTISTTYKVNDEWSIMGAYDYSHIRLNQRGAGYEDDVTNNRPNGYRLGVTYNHNRWNVSNDFTYITGLSERYTSHSYFLWDVGINYQWTKDTKVYAKLNNLTNEHYESTSINNSFYPVGAFAMPERNYVIGVTHTF